MRKLSVLLILALLLQAILVTPALATGGGCIDLAIFKTDSPDPIVAGDDLTYNIHIVNYGSSTANDVYVFDMYPTNSLTVQSTTPSQGTVGQSLPGWVMDTLEQELGITSPPPGFSYLTWEAGDLASGTSADLEIIATVNPDLPLPGGSPIINRALVMSDFDEFFWFNNYAITFTYVSPAPALPDIDVDPLDIDFGTVTVGLSSTPIPVTVTNNGNADLDIGTVTFTNSAFSIDSGDVSSTTLIPGESQIMNLIFTPPSSGIETGTMQINSNDPDEPVVDVDLTGTGTEAEPTDADLVITKSDSADPILAGGNITYTITVTNNGPADATDVVVTDTLPAGTVYQSATPSMGGAIHDSGNVTWTISTLGNGASASLTIVVGAPSEPGVITNTATVTSGSTDPNAANNTDSEGTTVQSTATPSVYTPTQTPTEVPEGTGDGLKKLFTVDFLGEITTEPASSDGRPLNNVDAYSPDGDHLLEINAGTRAADSSNNSVTTITIREATAPELPENTALVGSAYEFQPSGTIFDDLVTLTLGYDVADLPENVISVSTAYYEPGEGWKFLESVNNVVAEAGKSISSFNHFTIFAVLAQVPSESHITNPPESPVPEGSLSASFVLSNLSIVTSESKVWQGFTYVTRTGEDAQITVDVTNNGGQGGTYQAILILNGESIDSVQFDIGAGETKSISFDVTGNEPGAYTVQIGDQYGEFTSNLLVNWWLIAGSGLVVIVLISGLVYLLFIRNRNVIKLT